MGLIKLVSWYIGSQYIIVIINLGSMLLHSTNDDKLVFLMRIDKKRSFILPHPCIFQPSMAYLFFLCIFQTIQKSMCGHTKECGLNLTLSLSTINPSIIDTPSMCNSFNHQVSFA
jgi:hypothetical protein